jgi:hypothetical protein
MTIGERVTWRGLNREYSGTVVGFYRDCAVVELPTGKRVLLDNKPLNTKEQ